MVKKNLNPKPETLIFDPESLGRRGKPLDPKSPFAQTFLCRAKTQLLRIIGNPSIMTSTPPSPPKKTSSLPIAQP
jgi:hypothetical protein